MLQDALAKLEAVFVFVCERKGGRKEDTARLCMRRAMRCCKSAKTCTRGWVTKLKEAVVPAGRKGGGSVGMWKPS